PSSRRARAPTRPARCAGGASNLRPRRDHGAAGDDDDPAADRPVLGLGLLDALRVDEPGAVADARVEVDDRAAHVHVAADAERDLLAVAADRLEEARAHDDAVLDVGARAHDGADADDAVADPRVRDDRALAEDGLLDGAAVDLRARQVAAVRVDRER